MVRWGRFSALCAPNTAQIATSLARICCRRRSSSLSRALHEDCGYCKGGVRGDESNEGSETDDGREGFAMSSKTILVVDDDEDIRDSLRDAFEDAGYQVRCAANGLEGLKALQQFERPSVIVLDIIMPVMRGDEFYDALQADPQLADIPVILSTSDPSHAPKGVPLLRKPIHLQAMLDAVGRFA
jgi:CheY-like chemotaxis protein